VFIGYAERTLDGKGRLVLPSKLRSKLPGVNGYLTPHDGCLGFYPADAFESLLTRIRDRVRAGELDPTALVGIASAAEDVELDAQGRIGLPPRLRAFAGLESEVVVAGVMDHIEIWNSTRWAERSDGLIDSGVAALRQGKGY
jgi:MraZ protein